MEYITIIVVSIFFSIIPHITIMYRGFREGLEGMYEP